MGKRTVDTREHKIGQPQSFEIPAMGPVGELRDEIETVDTPRWEDKAKMEAFMNEEVRVKIMATGAPNEEQFVEVGNGGVVQFIMRGQWQHVKRKFVEVLARAKGDSISTPEFIDSNGNRATKVNKIPSLKYPFQMEDRNPDGQVWLERVLAEA